MDAQMRTIQKKRTPNFREDETKLLIQLWGNPLIQNKLFLTHRKAPVMRILAANMQQRGFYRTPDEIKTRIRNLKCLYHRIKRTMACGTGIGTVDPDWPHFKAMDAILSKQAHKKDPLAESVLEGPKCEDIKQEIEIDFNDDMESWATNDSLGSDYEDYPAPPSSQTHTTPLVTVKSAEQLKASTSEITSKILPTIMPSFTLPNSNIQTTQAGTTNGIRTGSVPSIPVPLLILNNLQPQQGQDKKDGTNSQTTDKYSSDLQLSLKELIDIQKENVEISRKRLDVEKQRLEFEKLVGSQLITLIPMIGELLQHLVTSTEYESSSDSPPSKRLKRRANIDSKILRSMLEQGIKRYMLGSEAEDTSDNEDSGIQNDEQSNASTKELKDNS